MQLRETLKVVDTQKHSYAPNFDAYLSIHMKLTAFLAYIGQARDMFKKMDSALGLKGEVWRQFQDLYQKRCSFLHGTLPAHQREDGIRMIPELGGSEKTKGQWHDESLWSQANEMDFEVVPTHLQRTFDELIQLTQGGLSRILTQIKSILSQHSAHLEVDPDATSYSDDDSLSGDAVHISSSDVTE